MRWNDFVILTSDMDYIDDYGVIKVRMPIKNTEILRAMACADPLENPGAYHFLLWLRSDSPTLLVPSVFYVIRRGDDLIDGEIPVILSERKAFTRAIESQCKAIHAMNFREILAEARRLCR